MARLFNGPKLGNNVGYFTKLFFLQSQLLHIGFVIYPIIVTRTISIDILIYAVSRNKTLFTKGHILHYLKRKKNLYAKFNHAVKLKILQ